MYYLCKLILRNKGIPKTILTSTKIGMGGYQNWYGGIPKMVLGDTKNGAGGYQKWC